mmetsp:Transcript_28287/g.65664  ORF Transcript_28287/g.65664 Transcript_28287/m.65664 type:complete len:240 (+) Transcript_28287:46-765(+)
MLEKGSKPASGRSPAASCPRPALQVRHPQDARAGPSDPSLASSGSLHKVGSASSFRRALTEPTGESLQTRPPGRERGRPAVPRLSLRRVFNQKERAGDYRLKMNYQCDTPEMTDSDPECTDDLEENEDMLKISSVHLDEAIEMMLRRKRQVTGGKVKVAPQTSHSLWHSLFGGCLLDDEDGQTSKRASVSVETLPVSMLTKGTGPGTNAAPSAPEDQGPKRDGAGTGMLTRALLPHSHV